jgi:hypothetical protein
VAPVRSGPADLATAIVAVLSAQAGQRKQQGKLVRSGEQPLIQQSLNVHHEPNLFVSRGWHPLFQRKQLGIGDPTGWWSIRICCRRAYVGPRAAVCDRKLIGEGNRILRFEPVPDGRGTVTTRVQTAGYNVPRHFASCPLSADLEHLDPREDNVSVASGCWLLLPSFS